MPIQVPPLAQLDPAEVEQFRASETALVQAYNPGVDLKRGPTQDLVITPKAALDTATQTNIDLVRQSNSLAQIIANPALADPTLVNNLLSTFGLTRKPGALATGQVTIVLSALTPTIIPTSVVFTINGQTFVPIQAYAGRTDPSLVIGPGDVLIVPLGSNFAFTINVVAQVVGAAGNISQGSTATLSQNPPQFVKAYAQGDFTGGQDTETNTQLVARLQSGLAIKAWSNRASIDAMIRQQFPNLITESIIGFGDAEQLRDAHAIWPGHAGGRSDIYIRTQQLWSKQMKQYTATLLSVNGTQGTWQFTVPRNDMPGFYEIDRILLLTQDPTQVGFQPSSDVRGTDLAIETFDSVTYFPDIVSAVEGTYSRYQTATIQFVDTITNASGLVIGSTAPYNVIFRTMPQVDQFQDFLGGRTVRPTMGDVLVKGAVPCFTSISMTVNVQQGTTVNATTVANAVAQAVNLMGFTGKVSASLISQTLHNLIGTNLVSVMGISMLGRIRRPDGTNVYISDSTSLGFVDDPAHMTTSRTVAFFVNPVDVAVNVVVVATPSV
jgi:hypothetical protein